MLGTRMMMAAANAIDLSYTHTDTGFTGSNSTTHTKTDAAIGSARTDRYVVVSVAANNSAPSGVTIGGLAATLAKQTSTSANSNVSIWYRKVTSGTTATVVATLSSADRALCHIGTIVGNPSLSVVDTKESVGTGVSSRSVTPVVGQGQLAVMAASLDQTDVAISWTGATEAAETSAAGEVNCGTAVLEDAGAAVSASWGTGRQAALASATFR